MWKLIPGAAPVQHQIQANVWCLTSVALMHGFIAKIADLRWSSSVFHNAAHVTSMNNVLYRVDYHQYGWNKFYSIYLWFMWFVFWLDKGSVEQCSFWLLPIIKRFLYLVDWVFINIQNALEFQHSILKNWPQDHDTVLDLSQN